MAEITFHVQIHEEDDGSYWAQVDELPGCFASGFSIDELKESLVEAMQMWLPKGINLGEPTWGPIEDDTPKRKKADGSKSAKKNPPKRKMLVCA